MIIIGIVSFVLAALGLAIFLKDNDETSAVPLVAIGLNGVIFSIVMTISMLFNLRDLRDILDNPQRYSAVELSNANKSVANIKRRKFLYYGFNLDGIDFIELDSAGAIKVDGEGLEK